MADVADRTWTSADGLSLYARDHAPGPGPARLPVICIHGVTRNSRDFEDIAPRIAGLGRRVLAVDIRGRGRSARDPKPDNYVVPVYVGDVAALMERSGIARAIFVGTSMGGLITMAMAAAKPKLVAGAVINDIGPEISPVGLARIAGYIGGKVEVSTWADAAAYARRINEVAFPHYADADWDRFARRTFAQDASGKPVLDYDPDISVPFKTAKPVPGAVMWGLYRKLAKGRPVLLLRGETSDILAPAMAAKMKRSSKTVTLVEVPGVGHAPALDEPAATGAIEAFLAAAP